MKNRLSALSWMHSIGRLGHTNHKAVLQMNGTVQNLLTELGSELQKVYGERLRGLYLYGSYARGERQWDSDVDVLIVLDRIDSYGAEIDRTGEFVARLSFDFGASISRVFVSEKSWRTGTGSFLANVREEGIAA